MSAVGRVTVALTRQDLTALILGRATLRVFMWSDLSPDPEDGEPIDLADAVVVGVDYDPACDEAEVYFEGQGLPAWAPGTYPSTGAVIVTHYQPPAPESPEPTLRPTARRLEIEP